MHYIDTIQSNNTQLQSLITRVSALNVGSGGGGTPLTITVNADSGATVTATKGDLSVIGISVGGVATLTVPEPGQWIVSAALDGEVSTSSVVNVVIDYPTKLTFSAIYGVEWDGSTSSVWTRTDDSATFEDPVPYMAGATSYGSPFDNLMPWAGMEIVEDAEAGTLVKIPKFYFKWTWASGTAGMKLQISPKAEEGFSVSPAHADRGDGVGERDYVYVGRYKCGETNYRSVSGESPKASVDMITMSSSIAALGASVWMSDYAMFVTILMLYLVEFADWDSQSKIGHGGGSGARQGVGASDSMPYHTGTMQSTRSAYGCGCQYRYIEGLWENVGEWVGGAYFSSTSGYQYNLLVIKTPSSSTSSGGLGIGTCPSSTGCISEWGVATRDGFEAYIYPKAVSGTSYTKYTCDRYYHNNTAERYLKRGWHYTESLQGGISNLTRVTNTASSSTGARLMKLP